MSIPVWMIPGRLFVAGGWKKVGRRELDLGMSVWADGLGYVVSHERKRDSDSDRASDVGGDRVYGRGRVFFARS